MTAIGTINWKEYQEQTAAFFRKVGLNAKVECDIEGVRGVHSVDVYVEGLFHGIAFKWVIECKAWNSAVPKEKVMALSAIVQDVGADRGFLLSEAGFQSGAVRAARKTNITLTSLEDLGAATEESFVDASIGNLMWRIHKARLRLRAIKKAKYDDEYYPPTMIPLGKIFILEAALEDAMKGDFPSIYAVEGDKRLAAANLDELLVVAHETIVEAEKWEPEDTNKVPTPTSVAFVKNEL
ncbi:MAG: restriction endonuclease [Chitinophagaceae bacterium]|nr:restriction endonuclease [Chitinophagaceae bacterium]